MNTINQRDYLIQNGFKPGSRGRFSTEMIQALKDSLPGKPLWHIEEYWKGNQ